MEREVLVLLKLVIAMAMALLTVALLLAFKYYGNDISLVACSCLLLEQCCMERC